MNRATKIISGLVFILMIAVAQIFFPDGKPLRPAGPVGIELYSEISRLVEDAGGTIAAKNCEMSGKQAISVSCGGVSVASDTLRKQIEVGGWRYEKAGRSMGFARSENFLRTNDWLTYEVDNEEIVRTVAISRSF